MPQAWGFNVHPWALGPHEGLNWSSPHEYMSTRKILAKIQQVRPPGVHKSQVSWQVNHI
jgi:hypothetical protein